MASISAGTCRVCSSTSGAWVEPDLCCACSPTVELRAALDQAVTQGHCSRGEADEAFSFFNELSDAELRGEVGQRDALQLVEMFGFGQLDRRARS